MGPLEEKVREIMDTVCTGKVLDRTTEEILEAHCGIFAFYAMRKLLESQQQASEMAAKRKTMEFQTCQGMIAAYQELFAMFAFDSAPGEEVAPELMTRAMEFWQERVSETTQTA